MIAGVDTDTHAIHVVVLDDDPSVGAYRRYPIDVGPGDYHQRARRLPTCIPPRGGWRDAGVHLIAIEEPFSAAFRGAVPLAVIRGALLASLPRDEQCPVLMLSPAEWRKWSLGGGFPGKGNAPKDEVALWAKGQWANRPAGADQNAFDAYAIARAALALEEEGQRRVA